MGGELACIDFQDMDLQRTPRGFSTAMTGAGGPASWEIRADPGSPDGRLLAQTSTDETSGRFPLCVLDGFTSADASVSVRYQAIAGEVDRAAGIVARYRDRDNYYVTRANALEGNVRLYRVKDGKREQFAGAERPVSSGAWHTLRLDVQGKRFAVFHDDALLFTVEDDTFDQPGRIGVWTKADSVTWFDDLCYGPVPAASPVAGNARKENEGD